MRVVPSSLARFRKVAPPPLAICGALVTIQRLVLRIILHQSYLPVVRNTTSSSQVFLQAYISHCNFSKTPDNTR